MCGSVTVLILTTYVGLHRPTKIFGKGVPKNDARVDFSSSGTLSFLGLNDIDALYKVRRKNCLRKTSVLAHNVLLSLTVHFSGRIAAIAVIGYVPWSVSLLVMFVSPTKTAEPIEIPLGGAEPAGPKEPCIS